MWAILIYISLFGLYLAIGLHYVKYKSLAPFLLVTVSLPLTAVMSTIHMRMQVNVYYLFVFTILFFHILNVVVKKRADNLIVSSAIIFFYFTGAYICYDLLFNRENLDIINLSKDIKPLLFIFFGFVLLDIFKNNSYPWNGKLAKKVLSFVFYASLIWFVLLNNTNLIRLVTNDPYYQVNETRYAAIGTSYVIYYFLAQLSVDSKFSKRELLFIFVPLFLSGNRTMFFAVAFVYVINLLLYSKDLIGLLKKGGVFVLGFVVLVLGVFSLNEKLKERVMSMFNYDLVMEQLFSHRFAPFISELESFEWYHYIFGKGIGETLFIPWFVYRENIEDFNITMDNIYLTLYVKYGIFSLLIYLLLFWFVFKINSNKRFKMLVCIFFLITGMTTALIYQTKFLFTLVLLAGFRTAVQQRPVEQQTDRTRIG